MCSKILATLIIYHLVHHPPKCVSSDSNLTGSSVETDTQNPSSAKDLKLVVLDIKSTKATDQYSYASKDKVSTFESKSGFGFSKVFQKKNSLNCAGSDKDIWEIADKKQYATKVIYNSSSDRIELTLADNTTKVFEKKGNIGRKRWTDSSSSDKDGSDKGLKIYTEGSDRPNDNTKYNEGGIISENKKYYTFKENAKCTEIKYGEKSLWKFKNEKTGDKYPLSVSIWEEKYVLITFDGGNITCTKETNDWKIEEHFGNK